MNILQNQHQQLIANCALEKLSFGNNKNILQKKQSINECKLFSNEDSFQPTWEFLRTAWGVKVQVAELENKWEQKTFFFPLHCFQFNQTEREREKFRQY
jgi:hypothetical protein